MKNEAKGSLVLFFLAGATLGTGVSVVNKLELMNVVPIMFIALISIVSAGLVLGLFPALVPTQEGKEFWIGSSILCLSLGIGLSISPAVQSPIIGLILGVFIGFIAALGVLTGVFLRWLTTAIIFTFKFFRTAKGR